MLDAIPEISDEEVLTNLLKQGSFEAVSKFLLRKSLSFEILEELKTIDVDKFKFLKKALAVLSTKDLKLIQGERFKGLTDAEKKEILKDIIQFSKKEKDEILGVLRQIKEGA